MTKHLSSSGWLVNKTFNRDYEQTEKSFSSEYDNPFYNRGVSSIKEYFKPKFSLFLLRFYKETEKTTLWTL